jgi:hypothetical protein
MSEPARQSGTLPIWVAVGVLLGVGILFPLLVGIYDRETPTFAGFPFYYWFQFLLIPATAVLTFTAFKLSQVATRRDRIARGQSPVAGTEQDR